MEVSADFNPPAVSSSMGQSFPPAMSSPANSVPLKRAFSEVEDQNISKPETHKLHKCDSGEQENRDPLGYDGQKMDIDYSLSSTMAPTTTPLPVDINISTQSPATELKQPVLSPNTNTPDANKQSTTSNLDAPSTPPSHHLQQQSLPAPPTGAVNIAPNKKQKLSPSSKETRRLEKEEKDRLKLEEKHKKEAEKRAKEDERKKKEAEKEEEKKKREAEREEKKKLKEEEKQAKEEEKRKKEEEREKKERSQMRLNAFFSKPASNTTKTTNTTNSTPSSPQKGPIQELPEITISEEDQGVTQSDYHKEFPAFFLQRNTHMSPPHQFQRDAQALNHIQQKLDEFLKQPISLPAYHKSALFNMIPYQRRKETDIMSIKKILAQVQASENNTIDSSTSATTLKDQLKKVSMKSLKFGEDVRPSYYGTFTRPLTSTQVHKICRNPYTRILPEVNYDYDSEAEWEEPDEGEDLDSEMEEDASEDGEDDMDGFLDDEEEQIDGRRRLVVGDLEPACTGIKWQDSENADPDMEIYRIEALSDGIRFPIDPFSTAYWSKPKVIEQTMPKGASSLGSVKATLHAYSTNAGSHTPSPLAPPLRSVTTADNTSTMKNKKPFPAEYMEEFKKTVEGCDLSKAGLIEVLKKRFPKVSKDTLKDTVNAVAIRVGQKEVDKKWTCK